MQRNGGPQYVCNPVTENTEFTVLQMCFYVDLA